MTNSGKLVLFGLDEDDTELLLQNIPLSDQSSEPQRLRPGHKGEPATTLLALAVTAAALKAWVAFLALKGSKRNASYEFEIVRPNGERQIRRIQISSSRGAGIEKDIIRQLSELGVDTSILSEGADGA